METETPNTEETVEPAEEPAEEPADVLGCIDSTALNYNPDATTDDNSCEYPQPEPLLETESSSDNDTT